MKNKILIETLLKYWRDEILMIKNPEALAGYMLAIEDTMNVLNNTLDYEKKD